MTTGAWFEDGDPRLVPPGTDPAPRRVGSPKGEISYIFTRVAAVAAAIGASYRGRPEYKCVDPVTVWHLPTTVFGNRVYDSPVFRQPVRCRRCPNCVKQRRAMWITRCITEAETVSRWGYENWFLTVTDGMGFDDDTFMRGVTMGIKRLRADVPIRYLLIFERQEKSGRPHCHAIVHPQTCSTRDGLPMNYGRFLTEFRRLGFIEAHVLTGDAKQAAGYVAKYLGKDPIARVRASLRYGDTDPARTGASTCSNHVDGSPIHHHQP